MNTQGNRTTSLTVSVLDIQNRIVTILSIHAVVNRQYFITHEEMANSFQVCENSVVYSLHDELEVQIEHTRKSSCLPSGLDAVGVGEEDGSWHSLCSHHIPASHQSLEVLRSNDR